MQEWISLITNVGFPIAACAYMAWANHDQATKFTEKADKMADAVNANTIAFNHLADAINAMTNVDEGE